MAQLVAGCAPPPSGAGSPSAEATLTTPTPTATARNELDHNDDIIANLYHCILEQCRALLIHFRSFNRRPFNSSSTQTIDQCSNSDEAVKSPIPSSPDVSESSHKQYEEGTQYTKTIRSDFTLDDIVARIYLWGDVVDTGRAQATSTLSPDLHRTIIEVLVECARDTKRLMKLCSARNDASGVLSGVSEASKLDFWLEKACYILGNEDVTEQSDSESESDESYKAPSSCSINVTQDILESLDESVRLLMNLLPGVDHLSSLKHNFQLDRPSVSLLEVSDPANLWVSQIRDEYPKAPLALAERLGEANWQRFCRLRILQDVTSADELGQARSLFQAPRQAVSTIHDSTLGSSLTVRSDSVKIIASDSSFASSANESSKYQNRMPPEPPEVALGKTFTCSICLQNITHVRSRADWKMHVFDDLRPYICLSSECRDLLTTYGSRKAWAQHNLDSHDQYKKFECHDCDYSCQTETLFDEHISSRHSQFNSKQRTALVAAAARYEHSNPELRSCPLCARTAFGTFREFTIHVCWHMEDLALRTLPRHVCGDGDDAEDDLASSGNDNMPSMPLLNNQAADMDDQTYSSLLPPNQTQSQHFGTIEVPTLSFEVNDAKQNHKMNIVPGRHAKVLPNPGVFYRKVSILHDGDPESKNRLIITAKYDMDSASSFIFANVIEALCVDYVPVEKVSELQSVDGQQIRPIGTCKLFFEYRNAEEILCVNTYVIDAPENQFPDFDLLLGRDHPLSSDLIEAGNEADEIVARLALDIVVEDEYAPSDVMGNDAELAKKVNDAIVAARIEHAVREADSEPASVGDNEGEDEASDEHADAESEYEDHRMIQLQQLEAQLEAIKNQMRELRKQTTKKMDPSVRMKESEKKNKIKKEAPETQSPRLKKDQTEKTVRKADVEGDTPGYSRAEVAQNDLRETNTQENLAKLAGEGDSDGVAGILMVLEKADTEAVIAAAKSGHEEVLQLLIAMGRPDPDPDPVGGPGMKYEHDTPMLAAIGRGHPEIVKLLAKQAGFNPTRRYRHRSYFELAEARRGKKWKEEYDILKHAYDNYDTYGRYASTRLRFSLGQK